MVIGKRNKIEGIVLPYFKTYYIVMVINTTRYWWKDRNRSMETQTEIPETDSCKYGQLFPPAGANVSQQDSSAL